MSARLRAFLATLADPARRPRWRTPLQRPAWYFPELTARPWHEPREQRWTARLEAATEAILRELSALRGRRSAETHPAQRELVVEGAWRTYPLYDRGRRFDRIARACPETTRVVESIPGATSAGLVYFSVLAPRTRISPHFGPTNTRLRCHLALHAPAGAQLTVGRETRSWVEGRCLLFDDSFEHEAHNPSDVWRVVLLVDVWHPELTAREQAAIDVAFRKRPRDGTVPLAPLAPGPDDDEAYELGSAGALRAFVSR